MKTTRKCISALATALLCAAGVQGFANENGEDSTQGQPVFRPPLVQQTAIATNRWDAQEPVETPEQENPAVAPPPGDIGALPPGCAGCAPCYQRGLNWIVGVESTFFWPQLSRTFLQTQFTNALGTTDIINNAALGSVDGNILIGPRITLGVQGECWGLVGRYWNAANWANNFTPAVPDSVQSGIILFDTFRAYTVDLELQRRFCWRNWDCFGFFGVRYASVNNDRNLWVQNTFGDDFVNTDTFAGQQFNGTGLTFGVFALRPLFCDDGALKAYVNNRYSVLFGNGLAAVQTDAIAANPVAFARSTDGALARGDGTLFIVELGAGLQWDTCLKCFPARMFFRTGIEWQYWDGNAGVNAASGSFADVITSNSNSFSQTADLLFDLVGFNLGVGLMY